MASRRRARSQSAVWARLDTLSRSHSSCAPASSRSNESACCQQGLGQVTISRPRQSSREVSKHGRANDQLARPVLNRVGSIGHSWSPQKAFAARDGCPIPPRGSSQRALNTMSHAVVAVYWGERNEGVRESPNGKITTGRVIESPQRKAPVGGSSSAGRARRSRMEKSSDGMIPAALRDGAAVQWCKLERFGRQRSDVDGVLHKAIGQLPGRLPAHLFRRPSDQSA